MSYFDVPLGRCEVMRTMVMIDQTEAECTLDNGCPVGRRCALAASLKPPHAAECAPRAPAQAPVPA